MSSPARIENLPKQLEQKWVRILGVDYLHLVLDDGSDLYLTEHGLPFAANLLPENYWTDKDWFHAHSEKLPGSSTLYKIEIKPVGGVSKPIVLKWSRMGQDIPGETEVSDLAGARFNSPFEEFGLVRELRSRTTYGARSVYTHKPLAIYVPRQIVEPERMGRKSYWMKAVQKKHREVALDPKRRYAVIYEWVKGIDAVAAWKAGLMEENNARRLVKRSNREMAEKGFRVRDSKPHHLIVRPAGNNLARDRDGRLLYALVDFELLERTPEHEEKVRALRRRTYLERQAHRFESHEAYQTRLSPVRLMDVDYVFGPVESTGGALWVVGNDPELSDYFLPERWRESPKTNLSSSGNTYETTTKDDIHLVCRVSKVGTIPPTNE
ncbi:MAG: hypothetical protein KGZ25_00660, partial [Planctomycetes bacterium]|nr:hypothetical protein [Planctomycetota bacterium]